MSTDAPATESRRLVLGGAALALVIALAAGLALAWTHTPLARFITRENAVNLAEMLSLQWWAPIAVVVVYTPASLVMFPRWLLTMVAVIAFGPWKGFALAMTGALLAGLASFLPGRRVSPDTLRRLAGQRLQRVSDLVERRGLLAVVLLRLVPVAPFPVVNLLLGAMRVRLKHFVLGTIVGMLPGMVAATILSDQLAVALEDPARVNGWLIGGALAAFVALAYLGQRILRGRPH
jgi:phospholipase D1/2